MIMIMIMIIVMVAHVARRRTPSGCATADAMKKPAEWTAYGSS
jgi:hypothetical protein